MNRTALIEPRLRRAEEHLEKASSLLEQIHRQLGDNMDRTALLPVTSLPYLSVRALTALRTCGVNTIGELRDFNPDTLNGMRNCGRKTIFEITNARNQVLQ